MENVVSVDKTTNSNKFLIDMIERAVGRSLSTKTRVYDKLREAFGKTEIEAEDKSDELSVVTLKQGQETVNLYFHWENRTKPEDKYLHKYLLKHIS